MFVLTAKVSKGRLTLGILALAAAVALLVLALGGGEEAGTPTAAVRPVKEAVRSNEERVSWLNAQGWLVEEEPVESRSVVIPREFTPVYTSYNDLQRTQGFDLTPYAGREATRYTYRVKNHPSGGEVVADLIIYRGKVIAGDVQCTGLEGFMEAVIPQP